MKLSARFTEYGLVGAFFLIIMLIILATAPPSPPDSHSMMASLRLAWTNLWTNLSAFQGKSDPKPDAVDFKEAIAATLGFVAVFVTGLLIDLFSVIFVYAEMIVFSKLLHLYSEDIGAVQNLFPDTVKRDYERFKTKFGSSVFVSASQSVKRIRLLPCYSRNFAFFVTYAGSGGMQLDALGDHLRVWRTARGIAASAILLFLVWLVTRYAESVGPVGGIVATLVAVAIIVGSMCIVGFNFS